MRITCSILLVALSAGCAVAPVTSDVTVKPHEAETASEDMGLVKAWNSLIWPTDETIESNRRWVEAVCSAPSRAGRVEVTVEDYLELEVLLKELREHLGRTAAQFGN
jgi:hypothetical protein